MTKIRGVNCVGFTRKLTIIKTHFLKGRASYVSIDVMNSKRQVCPTQPASYSHQLLLATPYTTVVE